MKAVHKTALKKIEMLLILSFINLTNENIIQKSNIIVKELRRLGVNMNSYVKVTTSSNEALQFLISS